VRRDGASEELAPFLFVVSESARIRIDYHRLQFGNVCDVAHRMLYSSHVIYYFSHPRASKPANPNPIRQAHMTSMRSRSVTIENIQPSGRPTIYLDHLLNRHNHPAKGKNDCICVCLKDPYDQSYKALTNGLITILPYMYRTLEQVVTLLCRYGLSFSSQFPLPDSFDFQWAHTGEFIVCAYFEECEQAVIPTYKWRLNTTANQHQFGMDLVAFDSAVNPPKIYLIAVKTTGKNAGTAKSTSNHGNDRPPSVVYEAVSELKSYLRDEKLDDDLEIITSNLHIDDERKRIFLDWYNPYTQGLPAHQPTVIAVPAIVAEEDVWKDEFANPMIGADFGVEGSARVISIKDLDGLVRAVYARGKA
jgi:hypothetical protein